MFVSALSKSVPALLHTVLNEQIQDNGVVEQANPCRLPGRVSQTQTLARTATPATILRSYKTHIRLEERCRNVVPRNPTQHKRIQSPQDHQRRHNKPATDNPKPPLLAGDQLSHMGPPKHKLPLPSTGQPLYQHLTSVILTSAPDTKAIHVSIAATSKLDSTLHSGVYTFPTATRKHTIECQDGCQTGQQKTQPP